MEEARVAKEERIAEEASVEENEVQTSLPTSPKIKAEATRFILEKNAYYRRGLETRKSHGQKKQKL